MHIASETQSSVSRSAQNNYLAAAHRWAEHDDDASTIIGVPFETPHPLKSMLLNNKQAMVVPAPETSRRLFKIRAADSHGHRSSASILINKMYATRGYRSTGLPSQAAPDRITLMACEHEDTIGTITIGFDSGEGLHVDELFQTEVDMLRSCERHVCEFTKLAMDSVVRSKRVLASLFHVAYIYAHRIKGFQDLLIEVNPRHVRFYEQMLGFVVKGPQRLNPRVNAPAVLLALDFTHAHDQIAKFGGKAHLAAGERSLYPYFFSVGEEAGIVARLRRS
ncbi:N-acyl amino acid synthase FeeM domain-containing protein [Piscinibacter sp.]|uniref:N-acyl amino acid synthase FeeM domain-containing protein n=1 Tax=Piscinibacter sp. TaxID=1903157 RepID=UPI002CF1496C|nr:long-chain N-acyl amino acid synthase [Albitalea sp.]HUG23083.1 long-chain N-acyl amino acid synthase [Albitalea sp.]